MRKIPSLFARDMAGDPKFLTREPHPDAAWVFNGEGAASRKWDGTACLIESGVLFRRLDCKRGKTPPQGFRPCQDPDPITGHWPGWILVGDEPASKWFPRDQARALLNGTYELCGPHFQSNPEHLESDVLIRHGTEDHPLAPRDYEGLRSYLEPLDVEGLVFTHQDGRMAKIKKSDFGLARPPSAAGRRR